MNKPPPIPKRRLKQLIKARYEASQALQAIDELRSKYPDVLTKAEWRQMEEGRDAIADMHQWLSVVLKPYAD